MFGKPFDLSVVIDGATRHVEVKGSSLDMDTVELTINEVTHAQRFQPTHLIVVTGIQWSDVPDGYSTTGGTLHWWPDWTPEDGDLAPRRFAYSLPLDDAVTE